MKKSEGRNGLGGDSRSTRRIPTGGFRARVSGCWPRMDSEAVLDLPCYGQSIQRLVWDSHESASFRPGSGETGEDKSLDFPALSSSVSQGCGVCAPASLSNEAFSFSPLGRICSPEKKRSGFREDAHETLSSAVLVGYSIIRRDLPRTASGRHGFQSLLRLYRWPESVRRRGR